MADPAEGGGSEQDDVSFLRTVSSSTSSVGGNVRERSSKTAMAMFAFELSFSHFVRWHRTHQNVVSWV